MRTVHLLTRRVDKAEGSFEMTVTTEIGGLLDADAYRALTE